MTEPDQQRLLRRSRSDQMIGGVCGGIAQLTGVDSTFVRIAFVALALAGGVGVLAYLVLWVVVPEETDEDARLATRRVDDSTARTLLGVSLVVLGALLLLAVFIEPLSRITWPLVVIGIGGWLLLREARR
jgi:phage shock protein C